MSVRSPLAPSYSTRISVATGGSNETLSDGGASISILGMEKNNFSCNFVDFYPVITQELLLIPIKKLANVAWIAKRCYIVLLMI